MARRLVQGRWTPPGDPDDHGSVADLPRAPRLGQHGDSPHHNARANLAVAVSDHPLSSDTQQADPLSSRRQQLSAMDRHARVALTG